MEQTITLALPANWEEIIAANKYHGVIQILNTPYEDESEMKLAMFLYLTGLNGKELGAQLGASTFYGRGQIAEAIGFDVAAQIIDECFPAMDFIFERKEFTTNPMPEFIHCGITYRGPSAKLSNQTGEEWMVSHHAQVLFAQTGDLKHLQVLIAANYHRVEDGERAAFTEKQMLADAEAFSDLPTEVVVGIMLWYRHSDAWWFEKFGYLFPETENPATKPTGFEVRNIVFELAGNKMDASWDVVKQRSRQDIFYTLDRLDERRTAAEEEKTNV